MSETTPKKRALRGTQRTHEREAVEAYDEAVEAASRSEEAPCKRAAMLLSEGDRRFGQGNAHNKFARQSPRVGSAFDRARAALQRARERFEGRCVCEQDREE